MKTVILCGGKGTRIRDVSDQIPKPMISIGNYPVLWHIMRGYAADGFQDFILCLGHKGAVIKDFFRHYRETISTFTIDFAKGGEITHEDFHEDIEWRVTLADTGEESLTGSRVKRIERFIGKDEYFLLTYGDGVSDVPVAKMVEFHKVHGKAMTVCGVRPPGRFGELEANDIGQITEFNEKPQATGGRISGGFFVCSRKVLDYLDPTRADEVLETGPMRNLARDGELMMYRHDGFWQCMDTYRDYSLLNELWNADKAPWRKW
ncbi:MAG TPA: glucose-1-phosphate cytidylyltransferase [Candidatus Sulfotelmatobacter sp.]|nr:glucose-1-phosphate cytidylyltransferase [Candidatus Sulfotelmatobacter sp.]